MGSNREIKSDGDIVINGITWPSSDGTANQIIKTDGSGNLSFTDDSTGSGGGVDEITSNAEAGAYTGTAKIIKINASEAVTFTSALADKIIIVESANEVIFQANLDNCDINHQANLKFENTSTDGSTDVFVRDCRIRCNTLVLDNSGNTSGNNTRLDRCIVRCTNFSPVQRSNQGYSINGSTVFCDDTFTGGDSSADLELYRSKVTCNYVADYIDILTSGVSGSTLESLAGCEVNAVIKINGTTYIDSIYSNPFRANKDGIDTKIVARVQPPATHQSVTTSSETKLTLTVETFDNTSAFDNSTNYRFTSKVKGYYRVSANIRIADIADTNVVFFRVKKNGSVYKYIVSSLANDNGNTGIINLNDIVELSESDYLEFFVQCSDASYDVRSESSVTIEKIN